MKWCPEWLKPWLLLIAGDELLIYGSDFLEKFGFLSLYIPLSLSEACTELQGRGAA